MDLERVKLKGREKIIQIGGAKVNAANEGLNVEDKRSIFIFDEIVFLPDFARQSAKVSLNSIDNHLEQYLKKNLSPKHLFEKL